MSLPHYHRHKRAGFTLLELSIVLIIFSIMLGGVLTAVVQETRRAKMAELQTKLDTIEEALTAYRKRNDRLPCPGASTLAITHDDFGKEANNPGDCTGGAIEATFVSIPGGIEPEPINRDGVVGGDVPVHTLGLSDEYAFDPWGGRFTYMTDINATLDNVFDDNSIAHNLLGKLIVLDQADNQIQDEIMVILISHGPNGHGAYQLNGTRKVTRSTNPSELRNCHCTSAGVTFGGGLEIDYYFKAVIGPNAVSSGDGDATKSFDDIIKYYTRTDFPSTLELVTDTP